MLGTRRFRETGNGASDRNLASPDCLCALASSPRRRTLAALGITGLGAMLLISSLASCSYPAGEIFVAPDRPLIWPGPPEPTRIEYVGALETSADLKPAVPFTRAVGRALFGREPVQSMLTPHAVCRDDRGRLFVADTNAQLVHVFDLEDRSYARWSTDAFAQPVAVAIDWLGRLLVVDSVAAAIFVFDAEGKYLGSIGEGLLSRPGGIAVDSPRQRLFVSDVAAHHLVVFDSAGRVTRRVGSRGSGAGEYNFPTSLAVDSVGRVYIADSLNFRVQVLQPDLTPLREIGRKGDMPGYFSLPKGLAIDSQDHLYVVDAHFEAVQIFQPDGTLLLSFGEEGAGPGQFWLPAGLCIDRDDRVWVADTYNRRVQVFQYRSEAAP